MFDSVRFSGFAHDQPARLALVVGGIDFTDKRVNREEFIAMKPDLPFGSLPTLEVDGEVLAQSAAITRYCSAKAGLYPSNDPLLACKIDMVWDTFSDITAAAFKTPSSAPDFKEKREEYANVTIPRYLAPLEEMATKNPDSEQWMFGDSMTMADIVVYTSLSILSSGFFDHVPKDVIEPYKRLLAVRDAVAANEKVADWVSKH